MSVSGAGLFGPGDTELERWGMSVGGSGVSWWSPSFGDLLGIAGGAVGQEIAGIPGAVAGGEAGMMLGNNIGALASGYGQYYMQSQGFASFNP